MLRVAGTAAILLLLAPFAAAETPVDGEALKKLGGAAHWTVVDARELSERSREPIPGAIDYGPGLRVEGRVLVIASADSLAVRAARSIESRLRAVEAFAVSGGIETLAVIRPELLASLEGGGMPGTFTIPRDTCQPGAPLHVYTSDQ